MGTRTTDEEKGARAGGSGRPANLPGLLRHHIGGKDLESATGQTFESLDPTTNRAYTTVAAGDREDVGRAVDAARGAFVEGPWPNMVGRDRARVLYRIAEAIEAREEMIAAFESFDTGLPITQARGQARRAAENFAFFADMIVASNEDAFRVGTSQMSYVTRKPVGVAGLITPWNTPFMLETWKLAPSLASGCTVVLKPAEWTPLSASLLPGIMEEAGVPPGVFNMVHGIGEIAGAALVEHPDVPRISFTGETATGKVIMRSAAEHLKGLSMELGGKSPCVVFADADLEAALDSALFGVFSLNGERCTAGSRILVEASVYDWFVGELAGRAAQVVVGPPGEARTELGALVHKDHYDRVLGYVEIGKAEGARLVAGGRRPGHLGEGNYLEATVFADVDRSMRIFQEEIFGPVVCVTPFSGMAEAVALANDTRYGLAAYVWTKDLTVGHKMAQAIDAGMVWLNSHNIRDLRTPFGGVKESGLGKEGGSHSIEFYSDSCIVHVALEAPHAARFGIGGDLR